MIIFTTLSTYYFGAMCLRHAIKWLLQPSNRQVAAAVMYGAAAWYGLTVL